MDNKDEVEISDAYEIETIMTLGQGPVGHIVDSTGLAKITDAAIDALVADNRKLRRRANVAERALRKVDASNNDASPTIARIVRIALADLDDREET